MKKIVSLILCLVFVFSFAACGKSNNESSTVATSNEIQKLDVDCNVFALNGPTGVGMVSLMDKNEKGEANLNYTFKTVAANDEIVASVVNKEADIAAVATNVASTLYKKTEGKISVIAINTLGVLNVVTKDENIKKITDLKGKTIYLPGQGANPEFIATYILEENGLKVGTDVNLEFVADGSELIPKIVTDKENSVVVIAPQPVATSITVQDKDAKIVINLNDEWEKVADTDLVMGCVIARNEFIEKNPQAVKVFLQEYKESINAVNSDTTNAGLLCEKYKIIPKAAIATKAIPYCNIVYQDSKELKANLSAYLKFLFDKKPAVIGGALPDDAFYYNAK